MPDRPEIASGTYDVIRKRLLDQAQELLTRTNALNDRRQDVFGGQESKLLTTTRVRTEHNCVPIDIVRVSGGRLLLGYQVYMGLKSEIDVSDVFAKLELQGDEFNQVPFEALGQPGFVKDFKEIFKYYRDARLMQLRRTETHLLLVFQTGQRMHDVKVLRFGIEGDTVRYLDNRGERDHTFPPSHDFEWVRSTRDDHVFGQHPHINVCDTIFVECTEGDFTIKIENNTDSGAGIFAEDVQEGSQGLDDADVLYADLESTILLKVKPYRENEWRHVVYNKQTQEAVRLDAIGNSCQQLPEGHGLIFPNGYYLQDGSYKTFPLDIEDMEFLRCVRAPNGEDLAYVYHRRSDGRYIILTYNMINRSVANPKEVNGWALFPDGRLAVFRSEDEPSRVHAVQIWQTPFESDEHHASRPQGDGSHLSTVGNRELVRAISDCYQINRLLTNQQPNRHVYEELIRTVIRTIDAYHWLGHDEAGGLRETLEAISATSEKVVDEFEKVQQLRSQADQVASTLESGAKDRLRDADLAEYAAVDDFVTHLDAIRRHRGTVEAARDTRYIDGERLDALDQQLQERADHLAQRAVDFLLQDDALAPYNGRIAELEEHGEQAASVVDADPLVAEGEQIAHELDLLMGIVNELDIQDTTQRTEILESIGEVYGLLGRARAIVENRRKDLATREGRAAFGAQFKLLGQTASNYLALCTSPEACDEYQGKILVQLEELEGRYIEFPEFLDELAAKREELYEGFQGRKQALVDERQRRAEGLLRGGERVLASVRKRALSFEDGESLAAFFASDPMVAKLRSIAENLRELDDAVHADDLLGQLKAAREDGVRALRDASELADGDGVVRFGQHRFAVNRQDLGLSLVQRDQEPHIQLNGTDFAERVRDEDFLATRRYWNQHLPSENDDVYRGEYLAWTLMEDAERGGTLQNLATSDEEALLAHVRDATQQRYDEGYERGVHDRDAARILRALIDLHDGASDLRHPPRARSLATLAWHRLDEAQQRRLRTTAASLVRLRARQRSARTSQEPEEHLIAELTPAIAAAAASLGWPRDDALLAQAADCAVITCAADGHAPCSGEAADLVQRLHEHLRAIGEHAAFESDLRDLDDLPARMQIASAWLDSWLADHPEAIAVRDEAALLIALPDAPRSVSHARTTATVDELLGRHPRIEDGAIALRLDEMSTRLNHFRRVVVPGWRGYQQARSALLERARHDLRLEEYQPHVLTSFVRNRLINEVYLPVIGANFAKQLGTVGEDTRTDRQGLLLLISPPGYGKTTLMEYIASVLGLTFMKINAPSLGHDVTGLDPEQAPSATARQELIKMNLALEMGNNVLLYLDDIQHSNPELLQKFISLCDGSRRIEGVWRGRSKTYDLRGKKFAVVMAGNPYTESGDKFQIPDMLANRADTYNLGDIIGGAHSAFEMSYLENCLSVNPVLAPLATRPRGDFMRLVRLADGDEEARSELEHPYSAVELDEVVTVLRHLRRIQSVLLQVNQAYIQSAATAEGDRLEPPFKLQGSYRNMARLAEKVLPVMTDDEVTTLLADHYRGESQTLTSAAEQNLLKVREIIGVASEAERQRYATLCASFRRRQELGGDDDAMAKALLQLAKIQEALSAQSGATVELTAATREAGSRSPDLAAVERGLALIANSLVANSATSEPKVEIVNTLPRYYGKLYEQHIGVLEGTLAPALEAIGRHLDNTQDVRGHLRDLVDQLRTMLKRANTAEPYGGEDDVVE